MVSSSCSTCGTRFTLDTDLVISHEIQQDPEWFYINSIYSVSSVYILLTFDEFNIRINSLYIGDNVLVGFFRFECKNRTVTFYYLGAWSLWVQSFVLSCLYLCTVVVFESRAYIQASKWCFRLFVFHIFCCKTKV